MRQRSSDYMYWAKTQSKARFNLATSGVAGYPLPATTCEIHSDEPYGYAPLRHAIAAKYGVDPDSVVAAAGASMANHLAMAALIDPGDEVLIEHPAYELILSTASYLGAEVKRFQRTEESGYALDPLLVRRAISPRTKLIVLTNLHNPSSVPASESALRDIQDLDVPILVDEVYLGVAPRSAYKLGPEFVVTSSLTKIYGLSGLRCGWILGRPELARAMWRLNDLFGVNAAHPAERLSVAAFEQLDAIRERARLVVEADRVLLREFLARETRVSAPPPDFGTTALLRLVNGEVEEFLDRLRGEYETSVVPGRFFGMPNHFRIGMGVNTELFGEGLRRIGLALPATAR